MLDRNKFNLTHYNCDPDTTFFNEQRIVLTTKKSKAGNRPFLDIGKVPDADLGYLDSINSGDPKTGLTKTINTLNSYLQRMDWPIAPTNSGASFQKKYYAGNANRLTQLSLNIIDYVRSKESKLPIVVPLRVRIKGYDSKGLPQYSIETGTDANSYIGATRAPRMTEMGLFIPKNPTSGKTYTAKIKAEIYLPLNFGVKSFDLTRLLFWPHSIFVDRKDGDSQSLRVETKQEDHEKPIKDTEITIPGRPPRTIELLAGERATITRSIDIIYPADGSRPVQESWAKLRFAISLRDSPATPSNRLDVCPLLDLEPNYIKCNVNARDVVEDAMPSVEVDDPRVNTHKDDWKHSSPHTFGLIGRERETSTVGHTPGGVVPEQDVDMKGRITNISLVILRLLPRRWFPRLAAFPPTPRGVMASAGELGFISTGMQSAGMAGTPWRTPASSQASRMIRSARTGRSWISSPCLPTSTKTPLAASRQSLLPTTPPPANGWL